MILSLVGKSLKELRNVALPKINSFLLERSSKLDLYKARIFFIEEGFDFLGFSFKKYLDIRRVKCTKKVPF